MAMTGKQLREPVDGKLIAAIFACAREHHVDNQALHEAIEAGFNKTSIRRLTRGEAYRLLDGLRGKQRRGGGASGYKGTARGQAMASHGRKGVKVDVHELVTTRELQMLNEAAAPRGWSSKALVDFIERQTGHREVRTLADFNKVFHALKAMNRRDAKTRGAA